MRFLLDTNFLSEATKPTPDPGVMNWGTQHVFNSGISAISLGEILKGIHSMPDGKRKLGFEKWASSIEIDFSDRIIPVDTGVMKVWSKYCFTLRNEGHSINLFDTLIAATALQHGLTVVTRNSVDFPQVDTVNPWEKQKGKE